MLQRVVVPVATEDDAEKTCTAFRPYLEGVESVVAVHVIEKAGGGIDKAPLEKREEEATSMLGIVEDRLGGRVPVETEVVYGTDVVDAVFEAATEVDATAVVFRAREGGRFTRLLSGDTSMRFVTEAEIPVVAIPRLG